MERFRGSFVALPTPFTDKSPDEIDFDALRRMVEYQITHGTQGLVVNGSTGEGSSLRMVERASLVEFTRGVARGRVPVLGAVGGSDTLRTRRLALTLARSGADGLLLTTPVYLRPSQRGLARHFGAIADALELPIVLYNVPARTAVDLLPSTVGALAERHANIVAIKEASGSLERFRELCDLGSVDVFCGDDGLIVDTLTNGAHGAISVIGNLVPGRVAELVRASMGNTDSARAAELVEELGPLTHSLALDTNPVPLKAALQELGWCSGSLRSPLVPLESESMTTLRNALSSLGLLS